jgi:hypothetical protein
VRATERQQQDAVGIGSVEDEVHDAMRQRLGLPRSGARGDEQGRRWHLLRDTMLDCRSLCRIQIAEV